MIDGSYSKSFPSPFFCQCKSVKITHRDATESRGLTPFLRIFYFFLSFPGMMNSNFFPLALTAG